MNCEQQYYIYIISAYLVPSVSLVGIFVDSFLIYLFVKLVRNTKQNKNDSLYIYLLFKMIHDSISYICSLYMFLYYNNALNVKTSYFSQVWYIWLYYYVELINELCSGWLAIAATLDCLFTILNRFLFTKRRSFSLGFVLATFLLATLYNINIIFRFKIQLKSFTSSSSSNSSSNVTSESNEFETTLSEFGRTRLSQEFVNTNFLIRDILDTAILFIANLAVLILFRIRMNNKLKMTAKSMRRYQAESTNEQTTESVTPRSRSKSSNARALRRTTWMVIVHSSIYIVGHLVGVIAYFNLIPDSTPCLGLAGQLFYTTACVLSAINYFVFNNVLKAYASELLLSFNKKIINKLFFFRKN